MQLPQIAPKNALIGEVPLHLMLLHAKTNLKMHSTTRESHGSWVDVC